MTSDTSKQQFRGGLLDKLTMVIGFLCAVPLAAGVAALLGKTPVIALMALIVAAPLLVIWLLLVFALRVYGRPLTRWLLISGVAPAILFGLAAIWGVLVLGSLAR